MKEYNIKNKSNNGYNKNLNHNQNNINDEIKMNDL